MVCCPWHLRVKHSWIEPAVLGGGANRCRLDEANNHARIFWSSDVVGHYDVIYFDGRILFIALWKVLMKLIL